ncbi:AcrR family transcriptional regulator [Dysgonomonas hofstadii]|uniref:AcrR family transcriptional regulator n=1 Tax=Dysgonomonas hofstadii TaxID=637886 RepID=A0A840CTJ6_9BACT|nr:helix-turn-helix domain-containing protein [Dysgonomonas hofstadii]MBB4037488.1 AcrR family transcriptional regulator [Dysgonomonas hofstadii]
MDTKEIILKKTLNLLLAKGFDAVSISDIQKGTGLSRGLLYHYFKNKEELFIEVTEKYFIRIFDYNVSKTDKYTVYEFTDYICKRFRKAIKSISDIVSELDGSAKSSLLNYHFLFYQVMQRDSVFRDKYKNTIEKELISWKYALRNSISKGELRKDIDITKSAQQLFTLTDGIWFQSQFSTDGKIAIKSLENALLHYIELLR